MIIDLKHNKVVADTITEAFERSVEDVLVPMLTAKYGDTEILTLQMYEDYISDNFMKNGYFYYPFTVVSAEGCYIEWVKWAVNDDFEGGVPYAYIGEGNIDFKLTVNVPEEFEEKLVGRSYYFEEGLIKLRVESTANNVTMLSGKYSQTFVDEMARQLTAAIGRAMSVEGIAESNIELTLMFAPGTYMEHISENVTYRRLIITDKGSAPRDFWVKWTRLDGAVAYPVSADVTAENILFELGEDVSQKIREKEYRYLVSAGKDKYHNAMGRKNVTEWREIIKRAVRRGELVKLDTAVELEPDTRDIQEKLASLLGRPVPDSAESANTDEVVPTATDSDGEFERAMQKMREMTYADSGDEAAIPVIPTEGEGTADASEEELCAPEASDVADADNGNACDGDGADELDEDSEFEEEAEGEPAEELELDASELGIVFETDDGEGDSLHGDAVSTELFDEEEEEEEELDELEAFYGEDESMLEISEGAVAADDEDAAYLEEITRQAKETVRAAAEQRAAENALREEDGASKNDAANEETSETDRTAPLAEEISESDDGEDCYLEFEECVLENSEEEEKSLSELRALEPDEEKTSFGVYRPSVEFKEETVDSSKEYAAADEVQAKLEDESRARAAAEQEAESLRRENETLLAESERLLMEAKREQEKMRLEYEKLLKENQRISAEREAIDAAHRAEEEKLRAQIEAQLRQEAREKERLAEAARLAIEEQRRREEENARLEEQRREEERRAAEERAARAEAERIAAARAAEEERIRREAEERHAAAMPKEPEERYTYTSKTVKLLFRRSVDPNITARIHEIIKATLEYYGKEKVYMRIRATVPDTSSVTLEFLQIPIEEMELLGNIIKILGNSGLGIAKAII